MADLLADLLSRRVRGIHMLFAGILLLIYIMNEVSSVQASATVGISTMNSRQYSSPETYIVDCSTNRTLKSLVEVSLQQENTRATVRNELMKKCVVESALGACTTVGATEILSFVVHVPTAEEKCFTCSARFFDSTSDFWRNDTRLCVAGQTASSCQLCPGGVDCVAVFGALVVFVIVCIVQAGVIAVYYVKIKRFREMVRSRRRKETADNGSDTSSQPSNGYEDIGPLLNVEAPVEQNGPADMAEAAPLPTSPEDTGSGEEEDISGSSGNLSVGNPSLHYADAPAFNRSLSVANASLVYQDATEPKAGTVALAAPSPPK